MPIFEYSCRDCGKQFERLVRSDATPECPGCHGRHVDKLLSPFSVGSEAGGDVTTEETCGRCGNAPGSCRMN